MFAVDSGKVRSHTHIHCSSVSVGFDRYELYQVTLERP